MPDTYTNLWWGPWRRSSRGGVLNHPPDVDPDALTLGIGVEAKPLQLILE
jgi:hypothetical protein